MWHLRGIFVTGIYMAIASELKFYLFLDLLCAVILGKYVYHGSSAMGHTYVIWEA